jgi:hypothetical protein
LAQLAEINEYSQTRWNFREEVLQFLENLKGDLDPLKENFSMVTGDMCCGSCAVYDLSQNMPMNNKVYGLYWSIQDEEALDQTGDGMWIGFVAQTDKGADRAAKAIVAELLMKNYRVAWDGTVEHRIFVKTEHLKKKPATQ